MRFSGFGKKQLLLLLAFSLVATQAAVAVNFVDTFQNMPVLQGLTIDKITTFYNSFWWLVDLIAYSVVLGVIFKFAAEKQFSGAGQGNTIAVVLAIVLGIGAVIFESRTDFRLANLGPIGIAVALLMIGKWIWDFTNNMGMGKSAKVVSALLYLAFYGIVLMPFKDELNKIPYLDLVSSIADIIAVVAIFMAFIGGWEFISGFWKRGRDETGGNDRTRRDVQVSEQEAQEIANVEQYEKKLDEFEKNLGKKEIRKEQQLDREIGSAITLAGEAENAEAKAEEIMQGVQAGKYGKDAVKTVESLRRKYKDTAEKLFSSVKRAVGFAIQERNAFVAELNELLRAAKGNQTVQRLEANLSKVLGADRDLFTKNHGFTGEAAKDFGELFNAIKEFHNLEEQKKKVLVPLQRTIMALISEIDKEIMDLNNLLTRMRAMAKTGNLRKQQLYEIKQNLITLQGMSKIKQPGLQRARQLLETERNIDNRIKEVAKIYQRREKDVEKFLSKLQSKEKKGRPAAHQRLMAIRTT